MLLHWNCKVDIQYALKKELLLKNKKFFDI